MSAENKQGGAAVLSSDGLGGYVTDAMHRAAMVYLAQHRVAVSSQHVTGALAAALAAAQQQLSRPASIGQEAPNGVLQEIRPWKG